MPLTKKTMILFDEDQYKKLKQFAKERHISVGQAIRESVETVVSNTGNIEDRIQAAIRLTSAEEEVDWDEFEKT
ncbi:MAG TPA: hypothetical protein VI584_01750, partial [Nitrospiria bacterium]|nr:hypothetical protein [Nitrospiria bacterium]